MKDCDDKSCAMEANNDQFKKALWICLIVNFTMFVVEISAGLLAHSVSLQANALDFLGDAANYVISLYVLNKSLHLRAYSSIVKALTFVVLAIWVLGQTVYYTFIAHLPTAETMGWVSILALFANVICAWILYSHRKGDSNRQSVWICSRNDAVGNIAVLIAAGAVYFTASKWPDLIVALFMALIALSGAIKIIRQAKSELRTTEKGTDK